jgi:hypothetical protein
LRSVDVGHGWLIFAPPPAETAIHPADIDFSQTHGGEKLLGAVLYPVCDDLPAEIALLKRKNVQCTEIRQGPWKQHHHPAARRPRDRLVPAKARAKLHPR